MSVKTSHTPHRKPALALYQQAIAGEAPSRFADVASEEELATSIDAAYRAKDLRTERRDKVVVLIQRNDEPFMQFQLSR